MHTDDTAEIHNGPKHNGPIRQDHTSNQHDGMLALSRSVSQACDNFLRSRGLPTGPYGHYLQQAKKRKESGKA